jgi:hypothetical protein
VKQSFPHSNRRAKGVLDIIHSYVCLPMLEASLSGVQGSGRKLDRAEDKDLDTIHWR